MKTALVTGANRGIGLELVRQLRGEYDHVIAACRQASPALHELGVELVEGVDVSSDAGIERLRQAVGNRHLDLLINNAGLLEDVPLQQLDLESIRRQFEINALGPLRVTAALLNCLSTGSKLALLTSRMGSVADNSSGGSYGYRMSKAALNIAGVSLARDLQVKGVAVIILHPGYVRTEMTGRNGTLEPAESAALLLARIKGANLENSGGFWHANGESLPW
jgi:NAD(P)-dependent dehydrogenase (short-subunit alcohol dehydrogenase family)